MALFTHAETGSFPRHASGDAPTRPLCKSPKASRTGALLRCPTKIVRNFSVSKPLSSLVEGIKPSTIDTKVFDENLHSTR